MGARTLRLDPAELIRSDPLGSSGPTRTKLNGSNETGFEFKKMAAASRDSWAQAQAAHKRHLGSHLATTELCSRPSGRAVYFVCNCSWCHLWHPRTARWLLKR